jgi:hypothetical protein
MEIRARGRGEVQTKCYSEYLNGRTKMESLGIDSRILFKSIVKKLDARICAETKWLLITRLRTFDFDEMWGNSQPAGRYVMKTGFFQKVD